MNRFWTTAELRSRGRSERQTRTAVVAGLLDPVRRGHFASPGADEAVKRAVRVGGIATATTASRALGIWTPPDTTSAIRDAFGRPRERLHVAVARNAGRLHDPDDAVRPLLPRADVVLHWVEPTLLVGTERSRIASPRLLLTHAFATLQPEWAMAMVDSALKLRFLDRRDLAGLTSMLPARLRPMLDEVDPRADSGLETIVRLLLRAAGLRVEVLRYLPGIGEVDLLVEGRLIVEMDGHEFHDDPAAFARDRRRDLQAVGDRYRVLRVTWHQVLFQWEQVEMAVDAALAG